MLWIICAANSMEIQSDFKELLELFNSHKVEYLVTGAYAPAFRHPALTIRNCLQEK